MRIWRHVLNILTQYTRVQHRNCESSLAWTDPIQGRRNVLERPYIEAAQRSIIFRKFFDLSIFHLRRNSSHSISLRWRTCTNIMHLYCYCITQHNNLYKKTRELITRWLKKKLAQKSGAAMAAPAAAAPSPLLFRIGSGHARLLRVKPS